MWQLSLRPTFLACCTSHVPFSWCAMHLSLLVCLHTGAPWLCTSSQREYTPRHAPWSMSSPESTSVAGGGGLGGLGEGAGLLGGATSSARTQLCTGRAASGACAREAIDAGSGWAGLRAGARLPTLATLLRLLCLPTGKLVLLPFLLPLNGAAGVPFGLGSRLLGTCSAAGPRATKGHGCFDRIRSCSSENVFLFSVFPSCGFGWRMALP
jgi:hypothetical protein